MANTLDEVLDEIVAGMQTVEGFSEQSVSKYDYRVFDQGVSMAVSPAFNGNQEVASSDSLLQIHEVSLLLVVTNRTGVPDLLATASTMVSRVLAWFAGNDQLDGENVISCHGAPLRWTSAPTIGNADGVWQKEITFVVSVLMRA